MNLPEVNLSSWMTSGESAELATLLRNPILRMAIRIVAESMPVPMPSNGSKESDIIFAAGVTAGLDMSLALLAELWSKPYAQAVMLDMEYDPAPPFEGGTPQRTPASVRDMMQQMYDMGMREELQRLKK